MSPDQPSWRRIASGILLFGGAGYFVVSLVLFLCWAPLEISVAGIQISIVSLLAPIKLSLALVLAGIFLRHYGALWMGPVLVCCGLGAAFFLLPHELGGDGEIRFLGLARLLEHGYLPDMSYSLVGPLFSTPLYWLGKGILTPEWWCSRYNVLLLALGFFLSFRLLRARWEPSRLASFFLILLAGSMLPYHLRFYFGEVFTAVWVAVGTLALGTGRPLLGWTAVVAGVVNTPAALPALGLLCFLRCFSNKNLKSLLPLGVAVFLILLENLLRQGGLFVTGYAGNTGFSTLLPYSGRAGFSYPLILGIFSILFSSGKGLLWFAPGMFLSLKKWADRVPDPLLQIHRQWLLFVLGLILIYAQWWSWYGGFFWGPRFFLFTSFPAALVLAARLDGRGQSSLTDLITVLVLSWSCWVGLNGAVYGLHGLDLCRENEYALEYLCWYVPEFSVLWRPLLVPLSLSWQQEVLVAYTLLVWFYLSRPLWSGLIKKGLDSLGRLWREISG